MDQNEQKEAIMEFEKNRQMLANISAQKQQLTMQSEVLSSSLDELTKTKDKVVWKAVGNILVQKEVADMNKELSEKKESTDLRLKTVEKQEETLLKKLNSLRSKIEGSWDKKESKESDTKEDATDKKKSRK